MGKQLVSFQVGEVVEGSEKLKKPFSACSMVFVPFDVSNLVVGKTEDVHAYFNSMNNFEYVWSVFETQEELEEGIKQITSKPTWYITWMRFDVNKLELGCYPPLKQGIDLGNPPANINE